MNHPALLRTKLGGEGGDLSCVEMCCAKRNLRARECMEELLEYGAEATDRAYGFVIEAVMHNLGGGGDFFLSLFKSGYVPREHDDTPIFDVLVTSPDEYFMEVILGKAVGLLDLALNQDTRTAEAGQDHVYEVAARNGLTKLGMDSIFKINTDGMWTDDGPFSAWRENL